MSASLSTRTPKVIPRRRQDFQSMVGTCRPVSRLSYPSLSIAARPSRAEALRRTNFQFPRIWQMPCFRPRFGKYTFPKNVHVYGGRCPSIHQVRFPHDIIPRCWILKDCRMNECGMVREKRRDPPLAPHSASCPRFDIPLISLQWLHYHLPVSCAEREIY